MRALMAAASGYRERAVACTWVVRRRHGGGALTVALAIALAVLRPQPVEAVSHVLVDARTGEVLSERSADTSFPAPGLGRLLVILLTLEQIRLGLFPGDVAITVSARAAGVDAGPLRLDPSRTYPLDELLRAAVVAGARDASVAVAELICGSIPRCLEMVRDRADLLGMSASEIGSLGGVPEASAGNRSSALDLAKLARALLDHPEVVRWGSLPGIPFDGGRVVLRNTNPLVGPVSGVDGLQAAYGSGHCSIIATTERDGSRFIAVVVGAGRPDACYKEATRVFREEARRYASVVLIRRGESLGFSIAIDDGHVDYIAPIVDRTFSVLQRRGAEAGRGVTFRYQLPGRLEAPLARDQHVGELVIERDGQVIGVVPARSPMTVRRTSLF